MKKYRILYVDDEAANLRIFLNTFRWDFDITTAISASEALKILQDQSFDLIITDQRMPDISGVDFLKELIQDGEKYLDVPTILISGYSDVNAISIAKKECKIKRFVHKPWQPEELKQTILNILEPEGHEA